MADLQLDPGSLLIDRYLIVKRIGGGGMGSVYLARDKRLADSSRAVKEMVGMHADENQRKKAIEDFERESQLLASLDHPSIPTIYDYFISEGCYYLVMKYISGGDLAQRLKASGGNLDEKIVTEWGIQIADVLHYLHSQNPPIIYRDMKPANIMLDEREKVVLVDFGIARFVAAPAQRVTAIGTMGYAPPELFAGKVEARSDIYSLGATMFHLLTGRDPQDNPLLMFDFNRNPRPKQINPKISDGMDKILAKAVEHKPANRFASAAEMREVLEQHLKQIISGVPITAPSQPLVADIAGNLNFCGQCGSKVSLGNAFCQNCGAPQKTSAVPPLTASLVYVGADGQKLSFVLGKETSLIGRLDNNRGIFPDIDLSPFDKDGKVSRRHAIIHRSPDRVSIEDLGSTNGTYINRGERLQPKKTYLLKSGDEVCLGETFVKFFLGQIPESLPFPSPLRESNPVSSTSPGINKLNPQSPISKNAIPDVVKSSFKSMSPPPPPPPPPNFQPKIKTGASAAKQAIPFGDITPPDLAIMESSVAEPQKTEKEPERDANGRYILRYFSNISFPKEVKLSQIGILEVGLLPVLDNSGQVIEKPHSHDGEIPLAFLDLNAATTLAMEIYIAAPGFEVEPDIFARFSVGVNRNASSKPFQLKAVQPGGTLVTVDFYQDTDYLTSVSFETIIVE